jgi:hypothetical protein
LVRENDEVRRQPQGAVRRARSDFLAGRIAVHDSIGF